MPHGNAPRECPTGMPHGMTPDQSSERKQFPVDEVGRGSLT
jgi:hypothetical protein